MDFYPLFNSIRIALVSTAVVFFAGIFAANIVSKAPRFIKGFFDAIFTLPLVLPPTVVGYLLLRALGPNSILGAHIYELLNLKLTMHWWSAVFATVVVVFPLMYRTARGAFQSYDRSLSDVAMTLGLKNSYIFWKVQIPNCKQGIVAGAVLSFARALGEYGATSMIAGFTPQKTATISTTVYHLWQTGNDELAVRWIVINIILSAVVLIAINYVENDFRFKGASHVSVC